MRFGVLGQLEVWTGADEPVRIPGAKVRALLALLLVHLGGPVSADRLREELWDEPPPDPAGALQTAVSRLRGALDRGEPGYRSRVESGPSGYRLRVDPEQVDAHRFEALADRARGAEPVLAVRLLDEALDLWRGPALAEHADALFAQAALARWEERRMVAVEDRAEARLSLGEAASLAAELDGHLRLHPTRERLRGAHMLALYRSGRQAEALESYRALRDLLDEDLGVEPGPVLARLQRDILNQVPGLSPNPADPRPTARGGERGGDRNRGRADVRHPARGRTPSAPSTTGGTARPTSRPSGNLPALLTDVVGREHCAGQVRTDLAGSRLVTLLGPGGVGKTTLALTSFTSDDPEFGPVWFVELAGGENGAAGVAEDVASALGIQDEGTPAGQADTRPLPDRIAESLADGPAVLLLDNCEHVTAPVSALAARLLRAAPGLRVLATSREPLGVPGERLHQVRPLGTPLDATPESLAGSAAVELFTRRAAASVPGFSVNGSNSAAVATVCCRLDGLPLALELAAARVRSLGVHELAERLDDRFRVLGSSGTGVPVRQRTLHAMVDWSWQMLGDHERTVLRRLSVHAGPFTLESAEAVAADPAHTDTSARSSPVDRRDVAGLLAGLVDRSLVAVEPGPGCTRYRILETIRAFAREKLAEAAEEDPRMLRFTEHMVSSVAWSDPQQFMEGGHPCRMLANQDTANIRAAVEWAADHGHAGLALRVTGSMGWSWYLRGRHREGYRMLTRALAAAGVATDSERATALLWHYALGQIEAADTTVNGSALRAVELADQLPDPREQSRIQVVLALVTAQPSATVGVRTPPDGVLETALSVFEGFDEPWWTALTLHLRGWRSLRRGEMAASQLDARRSLDLFVQVGEAWGLARANSLLGTLDEIEGAYPESARLHRASLDHAERIGLWPTMVDQLSRIARVYILTGDMDRADEFSRRAVRLAQERALGPSGQFANAGLGLSARRRGNLDEAERRLREVLAIHRLDGYRHGLAFALSELGFCAEQRGDAAAAHALHGEGLGYARQSGDPRAVAQALEGLAGADALTDQGVRAARLLGAATRTREDVGTPLPDGERFDVDRVTAAARALLGEEAFEQEWAKGRSATLDEAVRWVSLPEPAPARSR